MFQRGFAKPPPVGGGLAGVARRPAGAPHGSRDAHRWPFRSRWPWSQRRIIIKEWYTYMYLILIRVIMILLMIMKITIVIMIIKIITIYVPVHVFIWWLWCVYIYTYDDCYVLYIYIMFWLHLYRRCWSWCTIIIDMIYNDYDVFIYVYIYVYIYIYTQWVSMFFRRRCPIIRTRRVETARQLKQLIMHKIHMTLCSAIPFPWALTTPKATLVLHITMR